MPQLFAGLVHPVGRDQVLRQRLLAGAVFAQGGKGAFQCRDQRRVVAADHLFTGGQSQQHRLVQPFQLAPVQVAEEAGGGEKDVAPVEAAVIQRQPLQSLDDAAAVPHRFDPQHVQPEADHGALIAHRIGGPEDHRFLLPQRVLCERLLPRLGRQLGAQLVAQRGGQQAAIQGVEIAPGGQGRRSLDRVVALAGGDKTAVEGVEQGVHLQAG